MLAHNPERGFPTGWTALTGAHQSRFLIEVASGACQAILGCTMRAMAHRKPASSRAMAVMILGLGMPREAKVRERRHNRTCAAQALSRSGSGRAAERWRIARLRRAGKR